MDMLKRIHHLGIRVRDLEVAKDFYGKLGFEFIVGPIGPEPVAIVEHPCGININLILNVSDDAVPDNILMDQSIKHAGYTHAAIEVSDLDATLAHLEQEQIPLSGGPIQIPSGATLIFVRDPDGNVIEFHSPE